MKMLSELLVICLLGELHANALPEEISVSEDEQRVGRRYVESTIASEISKIMDSMLQRNFVNFLLNQRVKKTKSATGGEHPKGRPYNILLKLSLPENQKRHT